MDGEGTGDRFPLIISHIEPQMLAHAVIHALKVRQGPCDKVVPHAGLNHDIVEIFQLLAGRDLDRDPFAGGKPNVVAPLLVEGNHQLLLRAAVNRQPENIAGLDALKIFAFTRKRKTELCHAGDKRLIAALYIGVKLNGVAFMGSRDLLCPPDELGKSFLIVRVADRASWGVEHGD
ncbi:hypothetical protein SDC9_183430 [bioreactor metagenome]|uniref:Uncharacterized protein n=1 Tax=bioreactor metagenome TaxID=1076179 RepID=A0A645HA67_9ZZZZ